MAGEDRKAKEERVSFRSLQSAENCLVQANFGRAFAHYLLVLKLTPDKKNEIKSNFTFALGEWGRQLEQQGRLDDLFMCYQQACELFPECETMLNNMGAQLFRLGYVDEAACCFRRALKIDPDFLGARENLDNVCSHLVERWHFRMLNDAMRNRLYQEAIHRAVEGGHNTILDIGTGTGLLSLFAVEAGAKNVYGCEMSKTMYEVSCDVVSANQMEERIHLIHKISTDLEIPQDMPQWVTLVVTETFDAGLLGEHILDTLHHAWQHLLAESLDTTIKPRVIPGGATVYVCGIESEDIRKQNRPMYPGLRYLDLSSVNITCKTSHTVKYSTPTRPCPDSTTDTESEQDSNATRGSDSTNGTDSAPEQAAWNGNRAALEKSVWNSKAFAMPDNSNWNANNASTSRTFQNLVWNGKGASSNLGRSLWSDKGRSSDNSTWTRKDTVHGNYSTWTRTETEHENNGNIGTDMVLDSRNGAHGNHGNQVNNETHGKNGIGGNNGTHGNSSSSSSSATSETRGKNKTKKKKKSGKKEKHLKNKPKRTESGTGSPRQTPSAPPGGPRWAWSDPEETAEGWEPYTAERLAHLPQGYRILTNVVKAFHFDFCDFSLIHSYRRGFVHQLNLPVLLQGKLDALVMWFDLDLDSEVSLSSAPEADSCWEQAVFPVLPAHLRNCGESFLVKPGDALNVTCSCHDNAMHFRCSCICRELSPGYISPGLEPLSWLGSWRMEQNIKPAYKRQNSDSSKPTFYLSRPELSRLNDIDYNTALCNAVQALKMQSQPKTQFTLFDMSPGLSVFILQALMIGAQSVGTMVTEPAHQELICCLATANELDAGRIQFEDQGQEGDPEWDILVADLVEGCGCLHQQVLGDIAVARVTRLKPEGLVMPHSAKVYAMVIESPTLLNDSAVIDNDRTLGFRIAEFMNDFQMTTHLDIDMNTLDYKSLSEPFELFHFKFNDPAAANQVPAYLDQTSSFQSVAVETGQVTAVVYWFELYLTPEIKVCTLNPLMHWKQAAVMQKNNMEVSTGTTMIIKAACKDSCIDVAVTLLP